VLIHDPAASGHLYRIAQEAISNAVKHGKAEKICVELETVDDGTVLRVKDDGVGLPDLLPKTAGMGLRIMDHRARIIGATFEAGRGDSGGTVISCVLHHKNADRKAGA